MKIINKIKRFLRTRSERCPFCGRKERVPKEKPGVKQLCICTVCDNCWIKKDGKITKVLDTDADVALQEFINGFFGDD